MNPLMTLADIQQAAGLKTPIRHQLFIDGRFVDAESGETLATLNPHDNSTIAEVALAGQADVDRAVAAAQRGMLHSIRSVLVPSMEVAERSP